MPYPHEPETSIEERSKLDSIKIGSGPKTGPSLIKRSTKMRFASLHHHSTYSYLDGFGLPRDHVVRAAELGMSAIALTEHGNISSHVQLEQAAKDTGVKPIYGCELYTNGKKPSQTKNHLTVLAEDQAGYRNLLSMISWAWQPIPDGGFYYEPTVTGPILSKYGKGLVVLSGCNGSLLATNIAGGKHVDPKEASIERGFRIARRFKERFEENFYLEVQQFPELDNTRTVNQALEIIGKKLKIPLVATADVHYCRPEENIMQTILHAVRPGQKLTIEEQARAWGYDVLLCPPASDKVLAKRLMASGLSKRASIEAILNSEEIAQRCNVILPKASTLRFPDKDREKLWKKWLKDGWEYRGISGKRYADRLKYEVKIIEDKDFTDYFLIVGDMVRWAKDHEIFVGPARGSAAASLVCYLLRITEVDPLKFPDLVFERFIDITRQDLPDIDLDFDDKRRYEVFEYLEKRYGKERVGQLGTFIKYKAKNSLDDIARVYKIPKWEVEKVKELMIERSSGDLRASATIEDTAAMFPEVAEVFERFPDLKRSMQLEGMIRGVGKHAAGAIVSSEPMNKTCATYKGAISVDKYDAEYLNLLKIDNLGLNTCGMLAEATKLMNKSIEYIYNIPLDDKETIRGFKEGDLVGVFQYDGRAMRMVNKEISPDNFYEVCVINALARPGPLHNGAMSFYSQIKAGKIEPEMRHPLFDRIVANTQFQVVYQEQILRIVREIGGFDWTHAAYIRKIISRKIGEQEFNRQGARFFEGALKNDVPIEVAQKIWGMLITAGSYAFNAAHSVSYGMLAWWTMWLKRHKPQIFYLAALRRLGQDKALELMRDAVRKGIKILPPDPNLSGVTWRAEGENAIRAGFNQIPKIGDKQAQAIVTWRKGVQTPRRGMPSMNGHIRWDDLIDVPRVGPKTIMNIMEWIHQEDPMKVHVLDTKLKSIVKSIERGKLKGMDGRKLPVPTHRSSEIPSSADRDVDIVWIGVVTARNLRDLFEINMARTGVPLKPEDIKDPEKREWVIMYGTDGDDVITIRVNRFSYPKFKPLIWNIQLGSDIVLVQGIRRGKTSYNFIEANALTVIE